MSNLNSLVDHHRMTAQAGDIVQLVDVKHRTFQFVLIPGEQMHTHRGIIAHDDVIGIPWGSEIATHKGEAFFLLKPTLADLLMRIKRNTQIFYPKEIGYLLVNMGIGPGKVVIEAGTGSGALTTALAFAVGPTGHVFSYERRPEMSTLAQENLQQIGLADRVTFKVANVADGFEETGVDALILDLPNPYDYMEQVRAALPPSAPFASLLPTTNQTTMLIKALKEAQFAYIEVAELMLRYYKPVASRFRPVDRMSAHTGFLITARPMQAEIYKRYFDSESVEPVNPAPDDESLLEGI